MTDVQSRSTLAKLTGGIVAIAAAWAAQKVVASAWTAVSGHRPPRPEDGEDAALVEIAAAAAITGALVALARVLASRGTTRFAARSDTSHRAMRS